MRGYQYDVVVAGGGAAGVAAAVGARKAGARTLLVERNPYIQESSRLRRKTGGYARSSVLTMKAYLLWKPPVL